jgi:hypothetical protein
MPDMDELYPALVEFVMTFRYPDLPGFADDRNAAWRLVGLGITTDGLETLNELVADAAKLMW